MAPISLCVPITFSSSFAFALTVYVYVPMSLRPQLLCDLYYCLTPNIDCSAHIKDYALMRSHAANMASGALFAWCLHLGLPDMSGTQRLDHTTGMR